MRRSSWSGLLLVLVLAGACGDDATNRGGGGTDGGGASTSAGGAESETRPGEAPGIASVPAGKWFSDVTEAVGLGVEHVSGASQRKLMPETLGSGGALVDFDGDGRLDVYLVNQHSLLERESPPARNRLFRQKPDGTFEDVTEAAGVGDEGFGLGCAAADYDGDGDLDLFCANFGRDTLYRNEGGGRFTDVTVEAGLQASSAWSVSAVFFDYDGDADLDLFVVTYVEYSVAKNVDCFLGGELSYCPPRAYPPTTNILYRNEGGGRFTDVSEESGIGAHPGKGLGVCLADFDADGLVDVYVANDGVRNHLFRNLGGGRFEEVGVESGSAYNEAGVAEAGMGTDAADLDGNGTPDILVTNLDNELNNAFLNEGDGNFEEQARRTGLGMVSNAYVGFGIRAFDYENDGDVDVYVANGHIADNIHLVQPDNSFEQQDLFFLGDGRGKYDEVLRATTDVPKRAGRGLAVGDVDNDGDPDLLITNNRGRPLLLRNDQSAGNEWVGLDFGAGALGALISYRVGGLSRMIRHLQRGSYTSAHDPRLLIGLGDSTAIEGVVVTWPDGTKTEVGRLASGSYHRIGR